MQPEHRDAAYLWDMLDAASSILSFIEEKASKPTFRIECSNLQSSVAWR